MMIMIMFDSYFDFPGFGCEARKIWWMISVICCFEIYFETLLLVRSSAAHFGRSS